ncbi:TlpA family protein disulfide reductase [Bdellovibrio bacteriovorus]|uniref:Cytochrome c biogenesis (Thioredoxin) n=1 Tax=Bdellovibrio bacteriovorus TaxID=959 RepID=A0A1Z3N8G1_BDEBC|nr:TlpA disulfide reductase family protein [Bdellovibrio bacteriovorus]ASD63735.1 cytochrome c biogenesis (thioredoxin) [Bdellovibrio bacteriovorus]
MNKALIGKIVNGLLVVAVLWVLANRLPGIIENFKKQNQPAPSFAVPLLDGSLFESQKAGKPLVIVFWATWCGPCEVELSRVQKLVDDKVIPADSVLAVSSLEDRDLVQSTVNLRKYSFLVGVDISGHIAGQYGVRATPTTALLDQNHQLTWITTGLSPLLEVKIRGLFK